MRDDNIRNGKMIKSIRKYLGLTQNQFADLIGIGHQQTISKWERDKTMPTLTLAQSVALDKALAAKGKRLSDFDIRVG